MKYLALSILVLCVYFTDKGQADSGEAVEPPPSVDYKGFCGYPCMTQNQVYQFPVDYNGRDFILNSSDPTIISFYTNGTLDFDVECFMKSGQLFAQSRVVFSVTTEPKISLDGAGFEKPVISKDHSDIPFGRVEIEGNLTHAEYRCAKYVNDDENGDIFIGWATKFEVLENYPSICDVCNGEGFLEPYVVKKETVVIVPSEMGCNLPLVCPVTNPEVQVQCTCDDEIFGSGFCCPDN